jgi:hypothetical protein
MRKVDAAFPRVCIFCAALSGTSPASCVLNPVDGKVSVTAWSARAQQAQPAAMLKQLMHGIMPAEVQ